ncbi:unnamed protein product, partial [Phaeothamnion confervicola]
MNAHAQQRQRGHPRQPFLLVACVLVAVGCLRAADASGCPAVVLNGAAAVDPALAPYLSDSGALCRNATVTWSLDASAHSPVPQDLVVILDESRNAKYDCGCMQTPGGNDDTITSGDDDSTYGDDDGTDDATETGDSRSGGARHLSDGSCTRACYEYELDFAR